MAVGYDFATVSKNIGSVLTGEIWEFEAGGLDANSIVAKIKAVDGLPKPTLQVHEVVYRNKTLRFPKYATTSGETTITMIEDAASEVRKWIYDNIELKNKDGVSGKDNKLVLKEVKIKAYSNKETVARTYTLKGVVITAMDDTLTMPEQDGAPAELTLTLAYSDYEISFG